MYVHSFIYLQTSLRKKKDLIANDGLFFMNQQKQFQVKPRA